MILHNIGKNPCSCFDGLIRKEEATYAASPAIHAGISEKNHKYAEKAVFFYILCLDTN